MSERPPFIVVAMRTIKGGGRLVEAMPVSFDWDAHEVGCALARMGQRVWVFHPDDERLSQLEYTEPAA